MTAPLAVLDIQRIGWSALRAHGQHDRREIGDLSHTDSKRTHLNSHIGLHACPEQAVKAYLAATGAKIDRRNETPFTRLLLSASPSFFRPGREDQAGEYDPDRTEAWVRASTRWLQKEFGSDAVHIAAHYDETTVHLHAVVVPTYDKRTKRGTKRWVSHHQHPAFASFRSYEACHDRYADMVRELGIERGERLPEGAVKQRHTTKRQWLFNGLRSIAKQTKNLLLERRRLDDERRRAEPALEAARMAARQQMDTAREDELTAHIETLQTPSRSSPSHPRQDQR